MSPRFRDLVFVLCALALLSPLGRAQQLTTTNAASSTLTPPSDASKQMIASAIQKINGKVPDIDGALSDLSQAIKANPNSTGAYVLRASLYCQKKQWPQAEADFKSAQALAPTNTVIKFQLVQIKFLQKQYDAARSGFVALENDHDLGDFASYMVFLCDLLGGHEAEAKKELDVFNDAMGNPSYYFANAAWSLAHNNLDDARSWLLSASRIYPVQKNSVYAQSLHDSGYLQKLDAAAPPQ
jgi:tetratricopeptide (TPR) repeat protein